MLSRGEDVPDVTWDYGGKCDGIPAPQTLCNFGQQMHCCPQGYAMAGAYFASDSLYCAKLMDPSLENGCYVEKTNLRQGMRACLPGYYMRGYHQNLAWATCCAFQPDNSPSMERLDGNPPNNIWTGPPANGGTTPWMGTPGLDPDFSLCDFYEWTHQCYTNEVMTGVHVNYNLFLCSS